MPANADVQVRWYSFQFVLAQLVDELSDMHNAIVRICAVLYVFLRCLLLAQLNCIHASVLCALDLQCPFLMFAVLLRRRGCC